MCAESTAADGSRAQQIGHAASAPDDDGPATAEGSASIEAMAELVPKRLRRPLRSLCDQRSLVTLVICDQVKYHRCDVSSSS